MRCRQTSLQRRRHQWSEGRGRKQPDKTAAGKVPLTSLHRAFWGGERSETLKSADRFKLCHTVWVSISRRFIFKRTSHCRLTSCLAWVFGRCMESEQQADSLGLSDWVRITWVCEFNTGGSTINYAKPSSCLPLTPKPRKSQRDRFLIILSLYIFYRYNLLYIFLEIQRV